MSAKDNLYLLKEIGVIKLTIGYHTIYDKNKSEERDIYIRQKILFYKLM